MKYINILCYIFYLFNIVFSFSPLKINNNFILHDKKIMKPIINNLHKHLLSAIQKKNKNDHKILSVHCSNINDSMNYVKKNYNNSIYLGWIPLNNETRLKKYYKFIKKNVNFDTPVQNIPLYYIICESDNVNNALLIKKIFYNPIIDLNIDLFILKYDLLELGTQINVTIDFSSLYKEYDNGRWKLIWSEIYNFN